jgi:thiol-disulfide isomerase/thioredoxin
LIDFWFSDCGPCRSLFPGFSKLYTKYKSSGFEIVSISTDAKARIPNAKKCIEQYDMRWLQLWDKESEFCKSLSINQFPTTFLVDEKGTILMKDMSLAQLQVFLQNQFTY